MMLAIGKERRFELEHKQKQPFNEPKEAFTTAPVLTKFYFERDVVVETDASDHVSARVLSQYLNQDILHPVAFFSKKHTPGKRNYEIYDNELLAVVRAFEEWRAELQSVINPL